LPEPGARDFLAEEALRASRGSGTAVITIPAPTAPLDSLLRAFPDERAFLWQPPEGPAFSGIGSAHSLSPRGEDRLEELREGAEELWKSIETVVHQGAAPAPPALFGGLAFEAGAGDSPPWGEFGDGYFHLPRWLYGRRGETAWLSLALHGRKDAADVDRALKEFSSIDEALRSEPHPPSSLHQAKSIDAMGLAEWTRLVEAIRRGILEKRFSKVVVARRSVVHLTGEVDPLSVIDRLRQAYPDCYLFLFRFGRSTFLGATPERLVWKRKMEIATEALAGTIDASVSRDEWRRLTVELLESEKDLGEHDLVVDAIRRKLEPLCSELRVPARPQIRELRNMMHLHTPMTGVLAHPAHILDLAAALHPTPSIGGVPTAEALRWILENEPERRGWYAGPIGWFDGEDRGDLAVALRSGLFCGETAHVYAGAGIVRDSDPEKEYAETGIKLAPVLRALGVTD
jgi:isochorismate synthase